MRQRGFRRSSSKVSAGAIFAQKDGDSGGTGTQNSRVQGSLRRFSAGGDGADFRDRPRLPVHPALACAFAAGQFSDFDGYLQAAMAYGDEIGLHRAIVRIVPYDPKWAEYFRSEKELLEKMLREV